MAARKKTELTYSQASTELDAILEEIETGTANIDVLSERVERASTLIKFCREKLAGTELRVNEIVDGLRPSATAEDVASDGEEA